MKYLASSPNLAGYSIASLSELTNKYQQPSYRSSQLVQWIYQKRASSFHQMDNIPINFRDILKQNYELSWLSPSMEHYSTDGTIKWIFSIDDNNAIEVVYIPEKKRATLCVSSQIGCVFDCSFCATGRMGFNRNLTSREVLSQIHYAFGRIAALRLKPISNVVFMGMGEPLANQAALLPALELLTHDFGFGLGKQKITVSTVGFVPQIKKFSASQSGVSLALSLHAPNNKLRTQIMSVNARFTIESALSACWEYLATNKVPTLTIEYTMLHSVNDDTQYAHQLANLLRNKPVKINLIPFNTFTNSGYRCSEASQIMKFSQILKKNNIFTTTRKNRGGDIAAACGQLSGLVADRTKRTISFSHPRYTQNAIC